MARLLIHLLHTGFDPQGRNAAIAWVENQVKSNTWNADKGAQPRAMAWQSSCPRREYSGTAK